MEIIEFLKDLLIDGLIFLRNYTFYPKDGETFSLMRILSLFIAFSISGAIIVFMSQGAILKHMGPKANKIKALFVASISGVVLAVCSCSVLPMFASIRKKGAGIGPAIAFLFSGPAINVLALTLTFTDIGADIAFARIIGAVMLAFIIGLTMYFIYNKSETVQEDQKLFASMTTLSTVKPYQKTLFFLTLFAILIFGVYEPLPTLLFVILLIIQLALWFDLEDIKEWGFETFTLAKKILPLFILGVFFAGILSSLVTEELLSNYVGENSYSANLLASVIGSAMYFATLTEVPIIKALLENGMHRGPAVALLLAGPSLSIPNMIIITKVLGIKRSTTYIALVILSSALVGLAAGAIFYLL